MKKNRKVIQKFINRWAIIATITAILFSSCQKKESLTDNQSNPTNSSSTARTSASVPFSEGSNTLLGAAKQNPYTIRNMAQAWATLASNGIICNAATSVHTTHYYVKFKPKDSDQYETLHQDSTLAFSDYPIESTVIQNGDYYHDPSLPDTVPTYQYTAVKIGYKFSKAIPYQIIDELYIPETDEMFQYENGGAEDVFVDRLLNQAYSQTGNEEDMIEIGPQIGTARFTPGGKIQIFDTRLQQYIGMQGVRVQARRWFVIYNATPDFNGNYRMSHSFQRPCNYSIWFATPTFAVRHNLVNTTFWIDGPKITGDWNYNLNNGYQRFAGHVFRGAFRYHFRNIGGLARPWTPLGRQVYIATDAYRTWSGINWIVFPVIKIARYEYTNFGNVAFDSDEIFSTTCHETAHTSHVARMNGVIQYWQVSSQLQESWPIAIEWFLSHIEYAERGITNYGEFNYHPSNTPQYPNTDAYQYWFRNIDLTYTSLYIDLLDNYNQTLIYTLYHTPDDDVTGYTLPFIEQNILKHSYGLSSLRIQLKNNKPAGVTDDQIDRLLDEY